MSRSLPTGPNPYGLFVSLNNLGRNDEALRVDRGRLTLPGSPFARDHIFRQPCMAALTGCMGFCLLCV